MFCPSQDNLSNQKYRRSAKTCSLSYRMEYSKGDNFCTGDANYQNDISKYEFQKGFIFLSISQLSTLFCYIKAAKT